MNILINRLPDSATIGGKRYPIETDYRAAVEFELMTEAGVDDLAELLSPFYPYGLPSDPTAATEAALWFYRCGEDIPEQKEEGAKKPRSYSFEVDADVIFADFWRYYKIDLSRELVHWWAFRALLAGLPEESGYKQRVYYRTCDLKGLPKAEQARINRIRKIIAITDKKRGKLTLEERNALMLEYVTKRSTETKGDS